MNRGRRRRKLVLKEMVEAVWGIGLVQEQEQEQEQEHCRNNRQACNYPAGVST